MGSAVSEGFDAATQWLDRSGMTPDQLGLIPRANLVWKIERTETGKWVEWLGKTQASDQMGSCMRDLVKYWTTKDPQAAGKWLAATPEGPTKNSAISAFSESVSNHDPEMAEQWAMTLAPGKERADTLKRISSWFHFAGSWSGA